MAQNLDPAQPSLGVDENHNFHLLHPLRVNVLANHGMAARMDMLWHGVNNPFIETLGIGEIIPLGFDRGCLPLATGTLCQSREQRSIGTMSKMYSNDPEHNKVEIDGN